MPPHTYELREHLYQVENIKTRLDSVRDLVFSHAGDGIWLAAARQVMEAHPLCEDAAEAGEEMTSAWEFGLWFLALAQGNLQLPEQAQYVAEYWRLREERDPTDPNCPE